MACQVELIQPPNSLQSFYFWLIKKNCFQHLKNMAIRIKDENKWFYKIYKKVIT